MISPFLLYCLKVCCISGMLYAIYLILLRDRNQHLWNRLFLLLTPVLSLVIPLIRLPLLSPLYDTGSIFIDQYQWPIAVLPMGVQPDYFYWVMLFYMVVSTFILMVLIRQIIKIYRLRNRFPAREFEDALLIDTNAPGTPFSWFRWIFWNQFIELNSPEGNKIWRHEMAHVRQWHSWDKLMIRLVLIFFWCNPFFWLIGRELAMVHEFLADREIAEQGEEDSLARMLLVAALPGAHFSMKNTFFYSPIKRRIMMMKNSNKKPGRWGQYVSLLSIAGIFLAFTIERSPKMPTVQKSGAQLAYLIPAKDTIPAKEIESIQVKKNNGKTRVTIYYKDGAGETMSKEEAIKRGFDIPPPPPPPPAPKAPGKNKHGNIPPPPPPPPTAPSPTEKTHTLQLTDFDGIIVVNGKEISKIETSKIDPNTIESIIIFKGKSAIEKYGFKGRNGVIVLKTRKD